MTQEMNPLNSTDLLDDQDNKLQCALCGNEQHAHAGAGCMICGGQMQEPLVSAVSLGINLDEINEGAPALSAHRILARYATECNVQFRLGDNRLAPEQVFQPEAILPVVCLDALRIWQSINHRALESREDADSFGIKFIETANSFFKYAAHPPMIHHDLSSVLRISTLLLAARRTLGMKEGEVIDLAPKLSVWDQIDWESKTLPILQMPEGFDSRFYHNEFKTRRFSQAPTVAEPVTNPFREAPNPY